LKGGSAAVSWTVSLLMAKLELTSSEKPSSAGAVVRTGFDASCNRVVPELQPPSAPPSARTSEQPEDLQEEVHTRQSQQAQSKNRFWMGMIL
jgi:hypothetical protein